MAEVRDELVPTDGLTNSSVKFAGLDAREGTHGALLRFDITDENQRYLATYEIAIDPQKEGTIDAIVAEGHRRMRDVLRQWLYGIDLMYAHYSTRPKSEP